ncbi:MAG: hypothetical protein IKZ34_03120 [Alphaproteobacteria bacterium]|nr:hypothetical protein [Alphaproteobacteria bacterium]
MSDLGCIVKVEKEMQPLYGVHGKRIVIYNVQTDTSFYRLPSCRFIGVPVVGASLEYINIDQAPKNALQAYLCVVNSKAR